MGLNEHVYKDPKSFNPDRYIPKDEGGLGEPVLSPFGFGRRSAISGAIYKNG